MKVVEPEDLSRSFLTRIKFDISNWRSRLQLERKISCNGDLRWAVPEGCECPQQCGDSSGPSRGRNIIEKILTCPVPS